MFLRTLYLDHDYREALEYLALREGLIERALPHLPKIPFFEGTPKEIAERQLAAYAQKSRRISDKAQLLQLVTLFDAIDTKFSVLDWSRLVDVGLILGQSDLLESTYHLRTLEPRRYTEAELSAYSANYLETRQLKDIAEIDAVRLMRLSKRTFVDKLQRLQRGYIGEGAIAHAASRKQLSAAFDIVMRNCLGHAASLLGYDWPAHEVPQDVEGSLSAYIGTRHDWLSDALVYTQRTDGTIVSRLISSSNSGYVEPREQVDELNFVVRTCLKDEILYLPQPTSLRQALAIRQRKPMVRFREVLAAWSDALRGGDANLEQKLRRDLRRANRDLRIVSAWRSYKESPFQFVINLAGGLLGPFGPVLTILDGVVDYATRKLDQRSNWLVIAKNV